MGAAANLTQYLQQVFFYLHFAIFNVDPKCCFLYFVGLFYT